MQIEIKNSRTILDKYEKPEIEIIEFEIKENIANISGNFGSGMLCGEE